MWTKFITGLRLAVSVLPIIGSAAHANVDFSAVNSVWQQTMREDSVAGYTRYILKNPDGQHVAEAMMRIELLDNTSVQVASIVRHRDVPDLPEGAFSGSSATERLMNI